MSGGGWGVGDVRGGAAEALRFPEVSQIVCLCGHNAALHARLSTVAALEPRLRVEAFTDAMPDWLAAADVLVHSTGGLTLLEALMCGCTTVSYGWGPGHVAKNDAAYRRHGLADVARSPAALRDALGRALARPRRPRADEFAALPSAASAVLALTGARATSSVARALDRARGCAGRRPRRGRAHAPLRRYVGSLTVTNGSPVRATAASTAGSAATVRRKDSWEL